MEKVYRENNITAVFGNERDFFKMCFERDKKTDNITEDFCLIPPEKNSFLDNRPELKKLIKMFLETINEYRIPDENERDVLSMKPGSIYYQVPLTEASFFQQIKQGGLKEAMEVKIQSIFDEMKNFAFGKPMSNWEIKQFKSIDREQVYDPYLSTTQESLDYRKQLLSGQKIVDTENGKETKKKFGVNKFETSLDTIFLKAMASALRSKVSQDFMPLFNGLRAILAFDSNINGAELDSVKKAIDDFIKTGVFGKSIIEPEYRKLYALTKLLRHATSVAVLSLNTVSLFRENITSFLRTDFNKSIDPLMKGQFTFNDYESSLIDILVHSRKNTDVLSFYSQLNFIYGLANVSQEQLAQASKTGKFNFNN